MPRSAARGGKLLSEQGEAPIVKGTGLRTVEQIAYEFIHHARLDEDGTRLRTVSMM